MTNDYELSNDPIYKLLTTTSQKDALEQILLENLNEEERQDYVDVVSGKKLPSLMSDVIAKKIFDANEHPERLEFLFQEITGDNTIKIKGSLQNEGYIISANTKKVVFDINSRAKDGRLVDMEFQVAAQNYFLRRGELYGSDLLMLQYGIKNGQKKSEVDYENVNGVILVFLLKHSTKELRAFDSIHYIHRFKENVADTGLSYMPLVQTVYVQLDKCYEQYKKGIDGENNKNLQLMLSMLMNCNDEIIRNEAQKNQQLMEILVDASKMVQNREVIAMLLAEKYAQADLNAMKSYAKEIGYEEGRAEGRTEGEVKGVNKLLHATQDAKNGIAYEELVLKYGEEIAKAAMTLK